MRTVFLLLLIVGLAVPLPAATPVRGAQNQDDVRAEILRRGDVVERVGAVGDATLDALAPPVSDADKWFISVLTTRQCAPCRQLEAQWKTDPWLLSLADPNDPANSWAHYLVYDCDDRSQAFRFSAIEVAAYPTILVQPPRSGAFGDAATVVYQDVYSGDSQQTAKAIVDAVRAYVAKHQGTQFNVSPPWSPTPRPDAVPVIQPDRLPIRPFQVPPLVPSGPLKLFSIPWGRIATFFGLGVGIPLAVPLTVWAMIVYRRRRTRDAKRLLRNTVAAGVGLGAAMQAVPLAVARWNRKTASSTSVASPATNDASPPAGEA